MAYDLPLHKDAKYWVGSEVDHPNQIMLTHEAASEQGYTYIDAFDAAGLPVASYMLVKDGVYTSDF